MRTILEFIVNLNIEDAKTKSRTDLGNVTVKVTPELQESEVLVHIEFNYRDFHLIPYRIEAGGFTPKITIGRLGEIRSDENTLNHSRIHEDFRFKKTAGFDSSTISVHFYNFNRKEVGKTSILLERQANGYYSAKLPINC